MDRCPRRRGADRADRRAVIDAGRRLAAVVAVSNEVGSGVVPATASDAGIADELGTLNTHLTARVQYRADPVRLRTWQCLMKVLALGVQNTVSSPRSGPGRRAGSVVLRKLAAAGRLERTAQGVYRVPVLAGGEHAPFAEAIAGRKAGVISHESLWTCSSCAT